MKRIIIIGCPGSGKSTFARALHAKTGIPLFHLDNMYWNDNKTWVERSVFLARLADALDGETWIIDGNYASTMAMRLAACDTVFWLDYPAEVCLDGVRARRGVPRSDMPWVETGEDAEFMEYVRSFNEEQRPHIVDLLQRQSGKKIIIFSGRSDADAFLHAAKASEK